MHSVAVPLAWPDAGEITVPNASRYFGKSDAFLNVRCVEEAQFHAICDVGSDREIRTAAVKMCAEREGLSRPQFHVV